MKKISTIILGVTLSLTSISQTTNIGGPVSFTSNLLSDDSKVPVTVMPSFDLEKQLEEDAINQANKVGPFRFGYENITNFDLANSGVWETTEDGDRIWRIRLSSLGALSMNVIFNDFFLPEGSSIHLYNKENDMVLGAYTSLNNNENNMLGSDLVKGESVVIEYFEPNEVMGQGRLLIGMVVHGYVDINNWYPDTDRVNESGACNMDVICSDGDPFWREIRSVARISVGGGLCSGTLVNNTANDGTPYFLTANHCGPSSMGAAVFSFNYNSTVCASQSTSSSTASSSNSVNGSTFRASNGDSDFGLVELNQTPSASYNVYYAGWNNSGAIPQTACGIHHPSGDVKKLAFDDDPLTSVSQMGSIANAEWRIEAWERNTTTEGGSSGSGLFDENRLLIGQLWGGQASCSNSINDYYGKFSMSWTGNGSSSSAARLSDWLDPQGTGATTLDGMEGNPNSILEKDASGLNFELYPNPASSSVFVELNEVDSKNVSIELIDMQGRVILSNANPTNRVELNIEGISSGVYFVKVSLDASFKIEKLIIE